MNRNSLLAIILSIFLVSSFVLLSPALASEYEGKTVTVPKFSQSGEASGQLEWLQVGLADMILNDLATTGKVDVVPRRTLEKLMKEQELQQSGAIDKETAVEIGNLAGARLLISGNYQVIDNFLRINATVYDVESGKSIGAANVSGQPDEVFNLEKILVSKILDNIELSLTQTEKIDLFRTSTKKVDALKKNYQGELALDDGDKKQARDLFQEAKEIDPGYNEARKNFQKTQKVNKNSLFSSIQSKEKGEKIFKKAIYSYGKDIWQTELENVDLEKDIELSKDGKSSINFSINVRWNYDQIKNMINQLKKVDSNSGAEDFWLFYTPTKGAPPQELKMEIPSSAKTVWEKTNAPDQIDPEQQPYYCQKYTSLGDFVSADDFTFRTKVLALNENGTTIASSPYVEWCRQYSSDYQPFGSYAAPDVDEDYKSIKKVMNKATPDLHFDFDAPIKIPVSIEGVSKNRLKEITRFKLQEKEMYISNEGWIPVSELKGAL